MAVSRNNGNSRVDLLFVLPTDCIEFGYFEAEGQNSRKQVRFLLHALEEGGDIEITDGDPGVKVKAYKEQADYGEIGNEKFKREATIPKLFHRTYSRLREASGSIGACYRHLRSLCAAGEYGR